MRLRVQPFGGEKVIQVIFWLAFVIFAAFGLQWIRLNDQRREREKRIREQRERVKRAFEMNREYRWED